VSASEVPLMGGRLVESDGSNVDIAIS
jgi:hypothetical protein